MMLQGLQALQADADTKVIVLVSKPPAEEVANVVLNQVHQSKKPTVICFLGQTIKVQKNERIYSATTLEEAALQAARLAGAKLPSEAEWFQQQHKWISQKAEQLRACLKPEQKYLRGLFSGGTLCYEAQVIWSETLKKPVLSNAPLQVEYKMKNSNISEGHCAIDLGEEEFTIGRPHPMINNDLRVRRMLQEARDPTTAVILLDVVIGYGAHPDPASELASATKQAMNLAAREGRQLIVLASVTGSEQDPQCLSHTTKTLEEAGIVVCESNAVAAHLTAAILTLDYWTRE